MLTGFYTPLALLACMPVSFCVFYWDAPLEGWFTIGAIYGYVALGANLFLCLAYVRSYASMFTLRAKPLFSGTSGTSGAPAAAQPTGA